MNFTSQICTTKEQSDRLLAMGLKKETADMHYYHTVDFEGNEVWYPSIIPYENVVKASDFVGETEIRLENHTIPAWSLHRLIEMMPKEFFHESKQWHLFLSLCYEDAISYEECDSSEPCYLHFCSSDNIYDNIIESIEWLIKEGHFNKGCLN